MHGTSKGLSHDWCQRLWKDTNYDTHLCSNVNMHDDCSGPARDLRKRMCCAQSNHFIGAGDYLDDSIAMVDTLTLEIFEQSWVIGAPVYECMGDADLG
jgi:hypothetical protein